MNNLAANIQRPFLAFSYNTSFLKTSTTYSLLSSFKFHRWRSFLFSKPNISSCALESTPCWLFRRIGLSMGPPFTWNIICEILRSKRTCCSWEINTYVSAKHRLALYLPWVFIDYSHAWLTTEICSEKWVIRQFCCFANIIECTTQS